MQRTTLSGMILGLMLLCCGGILFASEADELRKRAKAMRKEASVLAERGNKEQAERFEKEAVALLEAAEQLELKAEGRGEKGDRPDIEKEVRQLKERLHDLLAKERKLKEAKAPEKALAEVRQQIAGTGKTNWTIKAAGTQFDADGIKGSVIVDAKYVGKSARSPYISGSDAPDFIRASVLAQEQSQFSRMAAIIQDPSTPFQSARIITNHHDALPYFEGLLKQYSIPGIVVVKS